MATNNIIQHGRQALRFGLLALITTLGGSSLGGCKTAVSTEIRTPTPRPCPEAEWSWTRAMMAHLPVSEEEVEAVERGTPYSATLHGRLVWLDLREPDARARLAEVSCSVTVKLDAKTLSDRALLGTLKALSDKHEVGFDLNHTDITDAGLAQLSALTQLRQLTSGRPTSPTRVLRN